MATQIHSSPKNSSLNNPKFSNNQSFAKLWNRAAAPTVNPETLPTLPLATVEGTQAAVSVETPAQQAAFEAELAQVKSQLLQARRSAILARSQSMDLAQRQELCRQAQGQFEASLESLGKLGVSARRLGVDARRKFRAIEGAQEWRSIRHTIQRSAEMNQVAVAVAA